MVKTKVFVGNLSFKTTEGDLRKEFEVAGKVESANIITRGSRSLGYGFVEMGSLEEANESVKLLHRKLVDSREINVEVARPREDKPPQAPRPPRQPRGEGQQGGDANNGGGSPSGDGQGRPNRGRFGRRGRGRGFRGGAPRDGSSPAPGQQQGGNAQGGVGSPSQQQGGAPRPPRQQRPRAPRPPRSDQPRTPSTNTLYVSNLPFTVDDAKLSEIFAGLNVKQAHVVRKPNDRSKGFGFVEFHNEEDQQKALTASANKAVEGRNLTVKVALTELPKQEGAAAGSSAPAGTTSSPAPAGAATSSPAPAAAASPATSAPAVEQK